ncbi:MAG: hypothetical protein R3313_01915 [Candidatus Saccharimonadales bacterium]|nr:hypothetical protein [Candidatus Saccharimonadales bacterium]
MTARAISGIFLQEQDKRDSQHDTDGLRREWKESRYESVPHWLIPPQDIGLTIVSGEEAGQPPSSVIRTTVVRKGWTSSSRLEVASRDGEGR